MTEPVPPDPRFRERVRASFARQAVMLAVAGAVAQMLATMIRRAADGDGSS